MIIKETDFEKSRKKINELINKNEEIIFSSDNDELNRKILEKQNIDILLINLNNRKDKQKQRDSGFNHVLSKIAKQKNVKIGINLDEIIESYGKDKAEILSRIRQNISLCNKDKLNMKFISQNPRNKRNIGDLKSLGLILGMPTWMTKEL
jgi:RNase P/RNase MRP subunit p30